MAACLYKSSNAIAVRHQTLADAKVPSRGRSLLLWERSPSGLASAMVEKVWL
jgi:hypothetical protein